MQSDLGGCTVWFFSTLILWKKVAHLKTCSAILLYNSWNIYVENMTHYIKFPKWPVLLHADHVCTCTCSSTKCVTYAVIYAWSCRRQHTEYCDWLKSGAVTILIIKKRNVARNIHRHSFRKQRYSFVRIFHFYCGISFEWSHFWQKVPQTDIWI